MLKNGKHFTEVMTSLPIHFKEPRPNCFLHNHSETLNWPIYCNLDLWPHKHWGVIHAMTKYSTNLFIPMPSMLLHVVIDHKQFYCKRPVTLT